MKRFFLSIFLLLCSPSLIFGLEVRFKNEAVVSTPMLTLADVAEVSPGPDAAALSGIVLFPAPPSGEEKCFKSNTLKAYAANAVAIDSIQWGGAETVCVRREEARVIQSDIQSMIDARLREALAHLPAERVTFRLRNAPDPVNLPPGRMEYDVLFSDPDIFSSRQATVIIKVDGRVRENLAVAGRVEAFLPVVTAARELKRGTLLGGEHLLIESKNIAELREPCLDPALVVGKRLKRSVAMNQALAENDLDLPVLVERRQIVMMLLQKGALQITTKGQAATAGKMGDVIMVKNMMSNREVPCQVIGPGLAKVDF